jgi:hypothetical protein
VLLVLGEGQFQLVEMRTGQAEEQQRLEAFLAIAPELQLTRNLEMKL